MNKTIVTLLLLVSEATVASPSARAQEVTSEDLSAVVAAELESYGAPGMTVSLWRDGARVLSAAYGTADAETGAPLAAEMIGAAASLSKFVTAATALSLAADGRLDLDAPIGRYVSGLPQELGRLTLAQLLSNTAGFGELTPRVALALDGGLHPICEAMEAAALLAEPGETWGYSNTGFTLAGCVIEAVGGAPFTEVVARRIFEPVGMRRTTYSRRWAMTHSHSLGHDTRGGAPRVVRPFFSRPGITPAGELMSTVDDLNRLAQALMSDGMLEGRRVLPAGLLDRMAVVRGSASPFLNGGRSYGFGLFVREHRGQTVLEHEGVYPGFGASIVMVPARRLSAVAIANGRYAAPVRTTQAAIERGLGLEPSSTEFELTPLSEAAFGSARGRYESTSSVVELAVVEGRPSLVRGDATYPLFVHPHGHWEVPGDPTFDPIFTNWIEVVPAADPGEVRFVRVGWRLHRRVE